MSGSLDQGGDQWCPPARGGHEQDRKEKEVWAMHGGRTPWGALVEAFKAAPRLKGVMMQVSQEEEVLLFKGGRDP